MVLRPGTQRTFRLLRRTSLGHLFKSCPGGIKVKDILVNKTNTKSLLKLLYFIFLNCSNENFSCYKA